jgi:hypothetical protein
MKGDGIKFMHDEIFHPGRHYSEVQLLIAGLLGIRIDNEGKDEMAFSVLVLHCTLAF